MEETPSTASAMIVVSAHPGIPSILSPPKTLPSLRRTLSADLSWNRRPDHLPHIEDSSYEEDEMSRFEIWSSIRQDKPTMKKREKEDGRDPWPGEFDIWSSVESWKRSQWSGIEAAVVPPLLYVHPLVRRSSSCLSEKSLEICTESLGSESGSNSLSLSLLSETGSDYGSNEKKDGRSDGFFPAAFCRTDVEPDIRDKLPSHALAAIPRIKELARSFPPPLTSLSSADDGVSVLMQSRRENGRLIIRAVYVPCHKNFQAHRENGRLMLSFTTPDISHCNRNVECDHSIEKQEVADILECEDSDDAEEEGIELKVGKKTESNMEIAAGSSNIDCIGIHEIPKLAILMNNPGEASETVQNKLQQSLPPIARPQGDHSSEVYEHYLSSNPRTTTSKAVTNPSRTTRRLLPLPIKSYQEMKKHVTSREDRNKSMEDCWVSVMKDSRRRWLFFPDATFHCHVMT